MHIETRVHIEAPGVQGGECTPNTLSVCAFYTQTSTTHALMHTHMAAHLLSPLLPLLLHPFVLSASLSDQTRRQDVCFFFFFFIEQEQFAV